jgi:hypothetical protein
MSVRRDKRRWNEVVRGRLLLLIGLVAVLLFSGCAVTVGDQELRFRPGTRIPGRTVEDGDGERQHWDEWEPSGDHLFLIIRATF